MTWVTRYLPAIQALLHTYIPEDIFNADEFGLQYLLSPDTTIARSQLEGWENDEERITALACCNASGSELLPIQFIGNSQSPRAFKKQHRDELGFDYRWNQKAWMTSSPFYEWLLLFDRRMVKTAVQKVFLLIDNCSAHGTLDNFLQLQGTRISYLPPKTTSVLQPLDAGFVHSLKFCYRKRQMQRALDLAVLDNKKIYKVDPLQAMRWLQSEWSAVPVTVVQNCCSHTTKIYCRIDVAVNAPMSFYASNFNIDNRREELISLMVNMVPKERRMGIDNLLNHPSEGNVTEDISEAVLFETVIGGGENDDPSDEEGGDLDVQLPSLKEQAKSLAMARLILEGRGELVRLHCGAW